ncbi:hypothetical protein [Aestuariivirga sp.]|uniref:hypothetical protein n=1 Tax=Aestuariivirga sp. TaxID=2650926 RepID=UPI0039E36E27
MTTLDKLIAETVSKSVPPEISAMADHARKQHQDVQAVLAYGSCLRGVSTSDSLIDLYVLTADYSGVSKNPISRLGCWIAPPNVYYTEMDFGGRRYRAKYAVMPRTAFQTWMTARNPYFWARFSQPSALLFSASQQAKASVIEAITTAAKTMYGLGLGLPGSPEPLDVCTRIFAMTYGTELRAESGKDRARHVVESNSDYYEHIGGGLRGLAPVMANWPLRRAAGKLWSAARLLKAAFTFTGGADYLAWKIERHSGQKITLTAFQRRHPIVASLTLLPQLLKRGAIR